MMVGARFLIVVLVAVPAVLVAMASVPVRTAYACSVGPDWDPVMQSDVIVVGRLTSWREAPEYRTAPFPQEKGAWPFMPVEVTMRVDQSLKGDVPSTLRFVDAGSLSTHDLPRRWIGSGGSCGTFNEEPAGLYVVLGLRRHEDGSLRSSLPLRFFMGPEMTQEGREQVARRLGEFGLVVPPSLGSAGLAGGPERGGESALVPLAAGLIAAAGLVLAGRVAGLRGRAPR